MGTLFMILYYVACAAFGVMMGIIKKKLSFKMWILTFLAYFAVIIFMSFYAGFSAENNYKEGQIDYYKGKFKYIPVVRRCNDIVVDTVYIEK